MFFIVGLGNIGEEYENTRHNAGFLALSYVIQALHLPKPVTSQKYNGQISEGVIAHEEVRLLLPNTYMNQSGKAVAKLLGAENGQNLIVIYDDIDLPLGDIRVSFGRGDGGHNGLTSIIDILGSKDFVRIRIGIAPRTESGEAVRPDGEKLPKYVLGKFTKRELEELHGVTEKVRQALESVVGEGVEKAMNKFN